MSSFPLFRLPLVPIRSTLDMMDLIDRISLSMTSKKAYQILVTAGKLVSLDTLSYQQMIKLNVLEKIHLLLLENHIDSEEFYDKYRPSLRVEISDDIKFGLLVSFKSARIDIGIHMDSKRRHNRYEGELGNYKFGDANLKCWENKLEGFQMIVDLFKKIPTSQIDIYGGNGKDFSENLRFVVEWTNSTHQGLVKFCTVKGKTEINDKDYKFILDSLHPKEIFRLYDKRCTTGFQHDTHFKSNNLVLSGEWFTLRNLFRTECRYIWIYNSNFTYEDFTEYLSQWLAGRFSVLEFLSVTTQKEFDFKHIINKLSNGSVRVNEQSVKYIFIREYESIILRRKDGKVAKISKLVHQVNEFEMRVSTSSIASN